MKSFIVKIAIYCILLGICNFFLFKPGLWLYSDASYWFKNSNELFITLFGQFATYVTTGFYLGYDLSVFAYSKVIIVLIFNALFWLFGSEGSQIVFILSAYVFSFVSFYVFLGLFFTNTQKKYILSLLYTFNPLFFNLLNQGYIHIYGALPLFIFSFYRFFQKGTTRYIYLLLNIISLLSLIAYLRFIPITIIVSVPLLSYLLYKDGYIPKIRRVLTYIIFSVIAFIPFIINVFFALFVTKYNGAQNFVQTYGIGAPQINFSQVFSFFQAINVPLYGNNLYLVCGVIIFALFLVMTGEFIQKEKKKNTFFLLNLSLIILGTLCYALGSIPFGNFILSHSFGALSFLQNAPIYALYIMLIPFILTLGIVMDKNVKKIYLFSIIFLCVSISPFIISRSDSVFAKFDQTKVPNDYQSYFINPKYLFSEATYYIPFYCWQATYSGNFPTPCYNYLLKYSPIQENNARILSNESYIIGKKLADLTSPLLDNLRVTHNLKNIIVARDIPSSAGLPGFVIDRMFTIEKSLAKNSLLVEKKEQDFSLYQYKDKNTYDFLLYSPQEVVYKSVTDLFDNTLQIQDLPIVLSDPRTRIPTIAHSLSYKVSPTNPTQYFVKVDTVSSKPFTLQLDQTFSSGWKVKIVPASYFLQEKCTSPWEQFSLTHNARCALSGNIFDTNDIRLLFLPSISEKNHIKGNLIGNAWVIHPAVDNTLYLVIVFEKQIYVFYGIVVAWAGVTMLLLLTLWQEIKGRKL